MDYRAKKIYQDRKVVSKYEEERFKNLKGLLTNKMELHLIWRALNFVRITTPAVILDIPCGTGRLAIHLAKKGFNVEAVDISSQMLSYVKEKLASLNLTDRIRTNHGNAESLFYPNDSFDVCVVLRLFGHTPPEVRKRILKELKRVTKKYLILVYYYKYCMQSLLRNHKRKWRRIEWYPVTYKQIEEELEGAGLEKIKYFPLLMGISETMIVIAKKV